MSGPNAYTEGLLEIVDVVAIESAGGSVRVNIGDASTGSGIDSRVPFWGIDGFLSCPSAPTIAPGGEDPTIGGAAQYLVFADGNQRHGLGSRDRRYLALVGQLDEGDRVMYSPAGARVFCDNSENVVTIRASTACTTTFSPSDVQVEGLGAPEAVALYAVLQAQLNAQQTIIDAMYAAINAMLPILFPGVEIPPVGPLSAPLAAAYLAFVLATTNATNAALASSSVLKASPT